MRFEKYINDGINTKGNATAEAILQAASQLFAEKGYTDVKIRDIAIAANVNLGLIPYYFSSKENLAGLVFKRLNSDIWQAIFQLDMGYLSNAEKLYVCSVMSWRYLEQKPEFKQFSKFYYEILLSGNGYTSPCDEFSELAKRVIRDYHLDISYSRHELYLTALTGAEHTMAIRMLSGELTVTYEDILDVVVSDYFYNIGLSDKDIAGVIVQAKQYLSTVAAI